MGRTILIRLLDSLFRRFWLYLLPIVFLTIAACVYLVTLERKYISSGVIFTESSTMLAALTDVQNEGFSWNTPAQDVASEFSDLMKTDAFIRAIIQETGLEAEMNKGEAVVAETISEVRKSIWVITVGKTQVQVNGANVDPKIAYQLAQATISTFIQWKINSGRIDSETAGNFLQVLIQEYRSDVLDAQQALANYLKTHPQPDRGDRPDLELFDIQNLQADLSFAGTRLANALNKAEDARLSNTQVESNVRQKYTLVDAPDLPEKPAMSRRQMAMNAMIFVAAGVLLSGIAVIGATVLERSFRIPADVQNQLNLPVLAIVPGFSTAVQKQRTQKRKKKSRVKNVASEPLLEIAREAPIAVILQEAISRPVQDEDFQEQIKEEEVPIEIHAQMAEIREETPVLLDLQEDVPGSIQKERSRRRKKKGLVPAVNRESLAETPGDAWILLDHQEEVPAIIQKEQVKEDDLVPVEDPELKVEKPEEALLVSELQEDAPGPVQKRPPGRPKKNSLIPMESRESLNEKPEGTMVIAQQIQEYVPGLFQKKVSQRRKGKMKGSV